jgi:hypothetical protein
LAISGTRALVIDSLGRDGEAKRLESELKRNVRRSSRRHKKKALREAQQQYAERLLAAVLSPEGPIFPRSE